MTHSKNKKSIPSGNRAKKADELIRAISRRVDRIYPSPEALRERILKGPAMTMYLGIDPTSPHLHLGHVIPLLILKDFQKYGHKITLLIGDFTARIGDPTDKLAARQPLSAEEVKKNMKTFRAQAGKIISFSGRNPARFERNARWLDKLTFADVVRLASRVTVQQMVERDMFQKRIKEGRPIGLHEFLYPLMQGFDSVAMKVDAEVGGTDQTFNMLMGRELSREMIGREKLVITTQLLVNPATGKKASKTEGSLVNLDDSPKDIFGKVMAVPDETMFLFARLCTEMPMERIEYLSEAVTSGRMNPRDSKLEIARETAALVYGEARAKKEEEIFINTFSKKSVTEEAAQPLAVASARITANDLVLKSGVAKSKSDAWRLIEQGALEFSGEKIRDPRALISPKKGDIVKIGKHAFFRIVS